MPYLIEARMTAVPVFDEAWKDLPPFLHRVAIELLDAEADALCGPWPELYSGKGQRSDAIIDLDKKVFEPALKKIAHTEPFKRPLEPKLATPADEVWVKLPGTMQHLVYRPAKFEAKSGDPQCYPLSVTLEMSTSKHTVNGEMHLSVVSRELEEA